MNSYNKGVSLRFRLNHLLAEMVLLLAASWRGQHTPCLAVAEPNYAEGLHHQKMAMQYLKVLDNTGRPAISKPDITGQLLGEFYRKLAR